MPLLTPIERICNLPASFRGGNKSVRQLVQDVGLSQIESVAISTVLTNNPSLVSDWLQWSMDKRASSGWSFKAENGGYVVAFHPHGERLFFQDAIAACSEFVVREVTSIASAR